MIVDIYIGNTKLDTFKDEAVELNSSIANVNDITKNTTDYTKSFTVPASKVNNQLFKHYYNANIDNTFDARTKVNGRIELGGLPFKYGKWRLLKVQVKQGKPYAYTINFFGNLVSLKDKFKEDNLSDLDLSEFDHLYNSNNVKNGLINSLFSGNVIYNLFSKKQYYYNSVISDNVNTDKLANIAWGGGANVGVKWNDLKPAIRLVKIIEAIEQKYGVTFSNDFFGRVEFTDLFMWLNADSSILGTPTEQLINFQDSFLPQDSFGYNFTTDTWTNTATTLISYKYRIIVNPVASNVPYKVIVKNFGVTVAEFSTSGGVLDTTMLTVPLVGGIDTPFEYQFFVSSSNSIDYSAEMRLRKEVFFIDNTSTFDSDSMSLLDVIEISQNLPNIKVIDFMKGLFNMFKLVVIADQNDNVYINTLNDYYAQGKLYNLTRYGDFSNHDVERGNLLNKINFNFEQPTTLLNEQFKLNNNIAYGDEDFVLQDEDGNLLDGDTLDVQLPFEQIVYERLIDLDGNGLTNVMYGGIFDAQIEPVNPKAHIFYNQLVNLNDKPIAFIDDTDTKTQLNFINTPSHTLGFVNPQYSTIFGAELNEWNGLLITNTLYTNYYKSYVESIFNIKRRNFKYNCKNIPLRIMTKIALNDIIQIKNNYYRIDNYNFNLLTGDISFNLINSFENTLNVFNIDRRSIFVNYQEQTQSAYVTNLDNFDFTSTELWVSCLNNGNIVYFYFDENTTGLDRTATVTIFNTETLQEVSVFVRQTASTATFDNDTITFDSTLITFDNG